MALLVLQQLLGRLEELVADVALKHSRDKVDLEVPFIHATRLAHKIAEDTLEACREGQRREVLMILNLILLLQRLVVLFRLSVTEISERPKKLKQREYISKSI